MPMSPQDGSQLLKEIQSFSPGVRISEDGEVSTSKTGMLEGPDAPLLAEDRT
ncbi:hypothetical protein D3C81_2315980 [compost metagenome]